MRILVCVNRDLMSNFALNLLAPALSSHTIDLVLSQGVGKRGGTKARAIAAWQELERGIVEDELFPLLDARSDIVAYRSFEGLARTTESGRTLSFPDLNSGEGLAYVERFAPDLIVSIRFGQIFKAPLISVPKLGILNLHSGLLPRYRGVLATFWAMLEGDAEIGCTLHRIEDAYIDTGAALATHAIARDPKGSLLAHIAGLYPGGVALMAAALAQLEQGEALIEIPQDANQGRYFTYPSDSDVARFLAQGNMLYVRQDYTALFARYSLAETAAARILSALPPADTLVAS